MHVHTYLVSSHFEFHFEFLTANSIITELVNCSLQLIAHDFIITPAMLCVLNLFVRVGTYSSISTPKDKFLRNFSLQFYFTLRVYARRLL